MNYIVVKTIISSYKKDCGFGANYILDMYDGCDCGCFYCPYLKNEVFGKENALKILNKSLYMKKNKGIVLMGSQCENYNRHERDEKLTQGALELLAFHKMGCVILTKSADVVRDVELLQKIKANNSCVVIFSVTVDTDEMCDDFEGNVSTASQRFKAMRYLTKSGIRCGTYYSPIIPMINDTSENVDDIIKATYENGGSFVYPGETFSMKYYSDEQKNRYLDKVEEIYPGMKDRYVQGFRDCQVCVSDNNKPMWQTLIKGCKKHNMYCQYDDIKKLIQYGL